MEQNGEETKEVQTFTDQDNLTEVKLVQKKMKGKTKSVNRNKTIECKVCFRKMRSDNLKQHMKTHENLFTLTVKEDEMRKEIRRIKQARDEREKQGYAIRKIAEEEGITLEACGISLEDCGINPTNTLTPPLIQNQSEEDLEQIMLKNNRQHQEMIERGKRITDIMLRRNISEGSLTREHKHALDLYRKERSLQDFSEVDLKTRSFSVPMS